MNTATVLAFDGRTLAMAHTTGGIFLPIVIDDVSHCPDENPIILILERAKQVDLREIAWAETADLHTAEVLESYGLPVVIYPLTVGRLKTAFADYPHERGELAAVLAFDRALFYRSQLTEAEKEDDDE